MDNLSHTLAGLAAGALLHRALPQETQPEQQRTRHRLLLTACALASNFPDLDLILTPLLPEPLGYLLHHRGHTHTVLYALPQALLLCALLWLPWPAARRLLRASVVARYGLGAAMAAGFGLHLLMDYLNPYGIHPFHPFDSRWLYGDTVFIIEPAFWVALGVPLIAATARAGLRYGLLALLACVLAYFAAGGFLHWASLLGLYGLAAALLFADAGRAAHSARTVALGVVASCLFVLVQGIASRVAGERIAAELVAIDPSFTLVDSARSAFPANPLCWSFVSVEADEAGDRLRMRRGVLTLAPAVLPVSACPPALVQRGGGRSAILAGDAEKETIDAGLARNGRAMLLQSAHQGSLAALRTLQRENCHFDAWLRFARAPQLAGGVAYDLRFSSIPDGNFTTMHLDEFANRACLHKVPQWAYPRADLLQDAPRDE